MSLQPLKVNCSSLFEEGRQFAQGEAFLKLSQCPSVEIQVGQLDDDLLQGMFSGIKTAVNFGLPPVEGGGDAIPATLHGFYLLQQHLPGSDEQAVNAAPDAQSQLLSLDVEAKLHFLLVTGRARALQSLVTARTRQRTPRSDEVVLAAEVALAQRKLDQLADLNPIDRLEGCWHPRSLSVATRRGNTIPLRHAFGRCSWKDATSERETGLMPGREAPPAARICCNLPPVRGSICGVIEDSTSYAIAHRDWNDSGRRAGIRLLQIRGVLDRHLSVDQQSLHQYALWRSCWRLDRKQYSLGQQNNTS